MVSMGEVFSVTFHIHLGKVYTSLNSCELLENRLESHSLSTQAWLCLAVLVGVSLPTVHQNLEKSHVRPLEILQSLPKPANLEISLEIKKSLIHFHTLVCKKWEIP